MKSVKLVFGLITIILIAISIWMRFASFVAHGGYTRWGQSRENSMTADGVTFFALIFFACWLVMIINERKKRT